MAAPVDADRVVTNVTAVVSPWTVNLPAVSAGELLVAFLHTSNGRTFTATGWTLLDEDATDASGDSHSVYLRVADGSEGATTTAFTPVGGTSKGGAIVWRITGAKTTGTFLTFALAVNQNANMDPPSAVTDAGLAADVLAIAVGGIDGETGTQSFTAGPSGYSNFTSANSGTSGVPATNCIIGGATKQLSGVTSEDPGALTNSAPATANGGTVYTLLVHGTGASPTFPGSGQFRYRSAPQDVRWRRIPFPAQQFDGLQPVVDQPTIGGAIAGGNTPLAVVANTAQGANANGNTPAPATVLTAQGATGQGTSPGASAATTIQGALAQGNGAGATVPPDPGGAGGTGADPDAVVILTSQGATSGGVAPTESTGTADTPTPGGAIAGGNEPTAVVGLNIQGATGQGVSPTATATAIFTIQGAEGSGTTPSPYVSLSAQGASGSGNAPTDSSSESATPGGATAGGFASTSAASVDQGGSSTGSGSIDAVVNLTIQGATAHGNPPDAPLQEVATAGGAISGGNSPTTDAAVDLGGAATSSGTVSTYTLLTAQGATAGGNAPTEIGVTPPAPVGPTPGSGSARRQNPYNRILPETRMDEEEEEALLLISLSLE